MNNTNNNHDLRFTPIGFIIDLIQVVAVIALVGTIIGLIETYG